MLDEIFDSLLFMLSGMFFIMDGGWLLSLWTYRGVLFGFMYGLYSPLLRSNVMSKKSITFLLASIVILRPSLSNILQIFFLICSVCLGPTLHVARPSSLYSPTLISLIELNSESM